MNWMGRKQFAGCESLVARHEVMTPTSQAASRHGHPRLPDPRDLINQSSCFPSFIKRSSFANLEAFPSTIEITPQQQ